MQIGCIDCGGTGKYQPPGPLPERDCLACEGQGNRDYDNYYVFGFVRECMHLNPEATIEVFIQEGWTYWDLYPDDRDLTGLPEGPSRDTEWAEAVEKS